MADRILKHGQVSVAIPKELAPPAEAGSLSAAQVLKLPKPPRGLGHVCEQSATALEKAGKALLLPPTVNAKLLREAGLRADGIDEVIRDLDVVRNILQQANLLFDAQAWDLLRQLNDQLKAQVKRNPGLAPLFQPLSDFVGRAAGRPKKPAKPANKPASGDK